MLLLWRRPALPPAYCRARALPEFTIYVCRGFSYCTPARGQTYSLTSILYSARSTYLYIYAGLQVLQKSGITSNPSDVHQWRKQLLKIFGPELIRINWFIKTVRSAVWRRPRNFKNVTLVARRRRHFRGFWAILWVAQLPQKKSVIVHKDSLASCQRCRHSVEPRALTCHFKQNNLSAWWIGRHNKKLQIKCISV